MDEIDRQAENEGASIQSAYTSRPRTPHKPTKGIGRIQDGHTRKTWSDVIRNIPPFNEFDKSNLI